MRDKTRHVFPFWVRVSWALIFCSPCLFCFFGGKHIFFFFFFFLKNTILIRWCKTNASFQCKHLFQATNRQYTFKHWCEWNLTTRLSHLLQNISLIPQDIYIYFFFGGGGMSFIHYNGYNTIIEHISVHLFQQLITDINTNIHVQFMYT